jgi:thiamine pyrophosphate-dependent acetolactate synthase large subunit-like protein
MLNRRKVVRTLLVYRDKLLIVAGLGAPAYDLASCGDSPLDFPLWGAMGGAVMVGLGLALAQPSYKVLVLTGDGEMLMGLSSLATAAAQNPTNLCIVVLDNERFGETGQQWTHTAVSTNLAQVAQGCGIQDSRLITETADVEQLLTDIHTAAEMIFAVIKVAPQPEAKTLPPRDGAFLTHRMRAELLGVERALEG